MASLSFQIPTGLLHRIGQLSRRRAAMEFEAAARDPMRAQSEFLTGLLARHQATEYGRAHGFGAVRNPADYAQRVPLTDSRGMAPWVERLTRGERNLLTVDAPLFYGMTSGTTGDPTLVPVTAAYRTELQRVQNVAFWHVYRRFPEAFKGRLLYFVSPRRRRVAPDGLDVGSMSGFNFTEQSALVRALYAWPYELFQVTDYDTRSYLALYRAIVGDISLVTGIFPLAIVSLLRMLEPFAEQLAHDLERGTIGGAKALSKDERALFSRGLSPRPDLARRVRSALERPVEEMAATVWPDLRLVYCWTTSTAGLFIPELKRRMGPTIAVRDAIYAATEAWCNVPMGDEEAGGPLAVSSVYFEFIPEAEWGKEDPTTLRLDQLEEGGRYFVVTSNSSGLYRYVIGDLIEVCGRYHATPRVRFVRKAGATSNMAGELMDETHVNQAVGAALESLGAEATWFALVADPSGPVPGYTLRLELAPAFAQLSDDSLEALAAKVDAVLQEIGHFIYGDLRKRGHMRPVSIVRVPQGRYEAWRRGKLEAGAGEAQLKGVHLIADAAKVPAEFR